MTKEQLNAVLNHDKSYDGRLFYTVKGSKSVCRPSCEVKKPNKRNLIIFETLKEGLDAGLIPCRYCRPDQADWHGARYDLAERAKAYIDEHYTDKFSLDDLADALYVNKIYLSKCFKEIEGTTPLKYHNRMRCERASELLKDTRLSIEYIAGNTGFKTASHFSKVFNEFYGFTPSQYRKKYIESL